MVIDIHAHCIPAGFRQWLDNNGVRVGAEVVDGAGGQCLQFRNGPRTGLQFGWESLTDVSTRLAEMDRMGIDVQVLSGWIDLTGTEVPANTALEYSRVHNETLAGVAAATPDRFRTVGTAPLQTPDVATAVLEHAMDELGMAGVQLPTRIGDLSIDRVEGLDEFWAAAGAKRALLILHPLRPLTGVDLERYLIENSVGRPAESSIAVAGLILSGVFERHPDLRMCVVHGGGFLPFQIGRLDRSFHQLPAVAGTHITRPPSTFLEQIYVDTIVHDPTALRFVVDRLGSDHVVMGTDYPFPMGDHDPGRLVQSVPGLDDRQMEAILGGNAADLLP